MATVLFKSIQYADGKVYMESTDSNLYPREFRRQHYPGFDGMTVGEQEAKIKQLIKDRQIRKVS